MNSQRISRLLLLACLLIACQPRAALPSPAPTADTYGLSADEFATLNSLAQLDDYPLYTMRYAGETSPTPAASTASLPAWGCSLFAALGDETSRLYGRNFDWEFSPALLLFTDPPDGYASVSLVDIAYLGFDGENARDLLDLSLDQRKALLDAPRLPFDGMNEKGLAVGMAAVPPGDMRPDPQKGTIGELGVIRQILDHAATVEEAIHILGSYNIDMGEVPIHYLIASSSGESALVEFYRGEMVVQRNTLPWQPATNFLVAATGGNPQGSCPRYDRIAARLGESAGRLGAPQAFSLLSDVSQPNTQWSAVYDMTIGQVSIVMGRNYGGKIHRLALEMAP